MSKAGLNHTNARTEDQKALMAQIERDGVCPFCSEHFTKYHPKPILKETNWWYVTENMSPYEGTNMHFLFVYKPEHISSPVKMHTTAMQDLFILVELIICEYRIPGDLFIRFGDTKYNGSSVEHLHAQLIVGEAEGENTEPLNVVLGHKKK